MAPWERVPVPFWLLDAKGAGSAQTPLVAVDFDPVLPTVETTNFSESSLSAVQHRPTPFICKISRNLSPPVAPQFCLQRTICHFCKLKKKTHTILW